jgi:hypothetical protein
MHRGLEMAPFRVRIEARQCGWRRARISRTISRDANQLMFWGLAIPRSERHRENKRGLDMGSRLGRWCRSTDFVIVVPGQLWRKVFLQKWASGKKGPTTQYSRGEKPNPSTKERSSPELLFASFPALHVTGLHRCRVEKNKESRHVGLTFMTFS